MVQPETIDPYQPYRSELLDPARVRQLSVLRPWVVVRDAVGCWLTIIAAWTVAAWDGRWWVCVIAATLVGSRYYALFIIGHDGLHRRLFRTRKANDAFNDLVILGPIGAVTRLNNRNHLAHHRLLGSDEDPDRFKHACFNKSERLELAAFLVGFTSLWHAVHNVFFRNRASGDGYTLRDVAILGGWQVALVGGLTTAFGWWGYPGMWLVPVFVFTYLADLFRSFVEHSHPESDRAADHHRLVTFEPNVLERWFISPMNMNFHAAHHLWVGIPYYNLPSADAEMSRHPLASQLERRRSYIGYLLSYTRSLPLVECKKTGAAH